MLLIHTVGRVRVLLITTGAAQQQSPPQPHLNLSPASTLDFASPTLQHSWHQYWAFAVYLMSIGHAFLSRAHTGHVMHTFTSMIEFDDVTVLQAREDQVHNPHADADDCNAASAEACAAELTTDAPFVQHQREEDYCKDLQRKCSQLLRKAVTTLLAASQRAQLISTINCKQMFKLTNAGEQL